MIQRKKHRERIKRNTEREKKVMTEKLFSSSLTKRPSKLECFSLGEGQEPTQESPLKGALLV